jgi:nickel transport protein
MNGKFLIPLIFVSVLSGSVKAVAHGANIEVQRTQAITIDANYDTGEPLANAQVTVYSPENPSEPWLTGTTDDRGNFTFTPDRSQPGDWSIQVRQAGHGDIVTIPIEGESSAASGGESSPASATSTRASVGSFTPLQIVVMSVAVIWGFVGTALYFARGKK